MVDAEDNDKGKASQERQLHGLRAALGRNRLSRRRRHLHPGPGGQPPPMSCARGRRDGSRILRRPGRERRRDRHRNARAHNFTVDGRRQHRRRTHEERRLHGRGAPARPAGPVLRPAAPDTHPRLAPEEDRQDEEEEGQGQVQLQLRRGRARPSSASSTRGHSPPAPRRRATRSRRASTRSPSRRSARAAPTRRPRPSASRSRRRNSAARLPKDSWRPL